MSEHLTETVHLPRVRCVTTYDGRVLMAYAPAVPEPGPWVQTHNGLAMDLANPRVEDVHQHDIAVALARLLRFAGHTIEPFSVGQHSVLVLRILDWMWMERGHVVPAEMRLAALLHDAHEAYMGDISTPVANLPGMQRPVYALKGRLQRVIHLAFGLPAALPDEWLRTIAHADRVALATEKRDLMMPEPKPWAPLPDPAPFDLRSFAYRYDLAKSWKTDLCTLIGEAKAL